MKLQIGTVIARVRREKGLTQEALADMVGVSSAAVSKWETAASYPDITLLPPLARALGLTVDALLDFHAVPSGAALTTLTERLHRTFDTQGFAAGQQAAEALLCEYPSSATLKLAVAGLYWHYIAAALNAASDAEQCSRAITERCLALYEQSAQQTDDPAEALTAQALRVNALILLARYDEAEAAIDALPPKPAVDADALRLTLYLTQDRLDEADALACRALLSHVSEVSTTLMQRVTIARRRKALADAHRFADAFGALQDLFALDASNAIQIQLLLAHDEGDRTRMLDLFEQYIDARIALSLDYRDNPFFGDVQAHIPTPNEITALRQLTVRAIEEDELFSSFRDEPRFRTALDRLRSAATPER